MVIAASNDASVSLARAEPILRRIPHAELITNGADTEFVRFGDDYAVVNPRLLARLIDLPSRQSPDGVEVAAQGALQWERVGLRETESTNSR